MWRARQRCLVFWLQQGRVTLAWEGFRGLEHICKSLFQLTNALDMNSRGFALSDSYESSRVLNELKKRLNETSGGHFETVDHLRQFCLYLTSPLRHVGSSLQAIALASWVLYLLFLSLITTVNVCKCIMCMRTTNATIVGAMEQKLNDTKEPKEFQDKPRNKDELCTPTHPRPCVGLENWPFRTMSLSCTPLSTIPPPCTTSMRSYMRNACSFCASARPSCARSPAPPCVRRVQCRCHSSSTRIRASCSRCAYSPDTSAASLAERHLISVRQTQDEVVHAHPRLVCAIVEEVRCRSTMDS
jgi:hypothetical protein